MTVAARILINGAAVLAMAGALQGQPPKSALDGFTPPSMAPGSPAGSFALSGFDSINPGSRRLSFSLPLHVVRGRGEVDIPIELPMGVEWTARSYPSCVEANQSGCVRWKMNYTMSANWWHEGSPLSARYLPGMVKFRQPQDYVYTPYSSGGGYQLATRAGLTNTTLTATLGDRTEIELRDAVTGGKEDWTNDNPPGAGGLPEGFNRGTLFTAVDGPASSFMSDAGIRDVTNGGGGGGGVNANGWLFLKNGTRMHVVDGLAVEIIDRNGNKADLSYSGSMLNSVTDTNGHVLSIAYVASTNADGCTGKQDQITYDGRNGAQHTILVNFHPLGSSLRTGLSLKTYSDLFPSPPFVGNDAWGLSTSSQFNPCLVSDVVLPTQQTYVFKYNSHGLLARVELPAGGAYEYDHDIQLSVAGGDPPYSVLVKQMVTAKRTYRSAADTTAESAVEFDSPTATTRTVKHTANGQVLSWQRLTLLAGDSTGSAGSFPPSWQSLREWKTEELDGNGNPVRRTEKTWAQRPVDSGFNGETFGGDDPQSSGSRLHDPRVTEERTIWTATGGDSAAGDRRRSLQQRDADEGIRLRNGRAVAASGDGVSDGSLRRSRGHGERDGAFAGAAVERGSVCDRERGYGAGADRVLLRWRLGEFERAGGSCCERRRGAAVGGVWEFWDR